MTYVDNEDMDKMVRDIIREVVEPSVSEISDKTYSDMAQEIKSIVERYTGIRTEKGELYEIIQLEGEPYVMDA